jgi:hypothetical protein
MMGIFYMLSRFERAQAHILLIDAHRRGAPVRNG